jgi:DNA end-binding protein Ku
LPKRKQKAKFPSNVAEESARVAGRALWSGTITFGLVSIPVELMSAVRPRQTAMKLIDTEGHALGREYRCSKEGKKLRNDDLVRGYETEDGKMVEISDEEFESVAPEMSSDINLQNFVPADQIPPVYFQKPYFLAPAGKSSKAYHLLAQVMARTKRVGIGSFVMRDHEYLIAIVSDNGVLRADTMRYADEVRTPETIGLPKHAKAKATLVKQFSEAIDDLMQSELDVDELKDQDAEALQALVEAKQKDPSNVIHQSDLESEDAEGAEGNGQVIDIMERLRQSLSSRAVVTSAERGAPISLDEHRARKRGTAQKPVPKKRASAKAPRKGAGKSHRKS